MSRFHWALPEGNLLDNPRLASMHYLWAMQTEHGIEFTPEAFDLFQNVFEVLIERCVDDRDRDVEEAESDVSDLKAQIEELEAQLNAAADAADTRVRDAQDALREVHRANIVHIQEDHEAELRRIKREHEAEMIEARAGHHRELMVAKAHNPPVVVSDDGRVVLVRRREAAPPQGVWDKIKSDVE